MLRDASAEPSGLNPQRLGLLRTLAPRAGNVLGAVFSPDGRFLAVGLADGTARLYDARRWTEVRKFEGFAGGSALAFSPDGKRFVTGGAHGSVRVWEVETGLERGALPGHPGGVGWAAFSPGGGWLLTTGADGTSRVWDAQALREHKVLGGHQGIVWDASWSRDGRRVATSAQDGSLLVWDAVSWKRVATLPRLGDCFPPIALTADGRRPFAAAPGQIKLFNVETERVERTFPLPSEVWRLALTRDERTLVTAGADGLGLWDLRKWALGAAIRHHTGGASAVALHPNGRMIATAGPDRHVKIWGPAPGGLDALRPKGFLGIRVQENPGGGVLIIDVIDGTAAKDAGLQRGDVLRKVGGLAVNDSNESVDTIGSFLEGDEVEFEIEREGATRRVKVKLGRRLESPDK